MRRLLPLLAVLVATMPQAASALTLVQVLGIYNLFVGLFLAATLGVFFTGFMVYLMRFGTWPSYRTQAIEAMRWGVAMLFVLIVLLGIVQFFQRHAAVALPILAVIVVLIIIFFIGRYMFAGKGEGGEKKKEGAAKH